MSDQIFNVNCGFFDSMNLDRLYSADQLNKPYKRVISNGVFATPQGTPSTDLQVLSANNEMNIIVKKGEGLFGDKWFENPADIVITISPNTNIIPRIDSIIVQVDKRQSGRIGNIVYREGIPNSNPQPPAIGSVDNIIEYRIANINIAPGINYIGQDLITDLRGSKECPWVTSLIQQVDTSELFKQWQNAYQKYYDDETSAFNAFMENLTEQLTVNTNIVTYTSHYVSPVDGTTEIPINITNYNKDKDILIVSVNRLFATPERDYTISADGTKIILSQEIEANQNINFLVLQSVIVGDTETVLMELQKLNDAINDFKFDSDWNNLQLKNNTENFNETLIPSCRKLGKQVFIRGAIKNMNSVNLPICTLSETMRPTQTHIYNSSVINDNVIVGNCVLGITTDGDVMIIGKSGDITSEAMISICTNFITD